MEYFTDGPQMNFVHYCIWKEGETCKEGDKLRDNHCKIVMK